MDPAFVAICRRIVTALTPTSPPWRARSILISQLQVDVFNVMNANPVLGWRSVNYGTAAYGQVSGILNPRVVRLGAQFRW